MKREKKKKKIQWRQYLGMLLFLILGGVCGALLAGRISALEKAGASWLTIIILAAMLILCVYAAMFLQIIIHEAGHLLFGLRSGYRFSSFRIGSFMWLRQDGKLTSKRLSLAGTGGQCLMAPPDMADGRLPFVLYNLGGSIMNIVSALLFFLLYLLCKDVPYLSALLLMLAVIGAAFALMNGIPMRMGAVDNDGYNALSLGKNDEALRSFWVQMKTNERIAQGDRLKDMPEDWFTVPSGEGMKNSMTAAIGVFACNRLMDMHEFERADKLMAELLTMESAMAGVHRSLMVCDRIYCELIGERREDRLTAMLDKKQRQFMKSMKSFPSVLRTEYAWALLFEKNAVKAEKIKERFEKRARTYPYPSDMESERELVEIAASRLESAVK